MFYVKAMSTRAHARLFKNNKIESVSIRMRSKQRILLERK